MPLRESRDRRVIAQTVLRKFGRLGVARAFLTSDCETPNCRAIVEGFTPALKAARTAFSLAVVNEATPPAEGARRSCDPTLSGAGS